MQARLPTIEQIDGIVPGDQGTEESMRLPSPTQITVTFLLICSLFLSACQLVSNLLSGAEAQIAVERSDQTVTDLQDIQQLRTLFNAAADTPRLILLLSPK